MYLCDRLNIHPRLLCPPLNRSSFAVLGDHPMEFAGLAANQTPLIATELNPGLTPAALLPLADLTPLNGSASRLVFVDAGVAGYEDLVAGIGNRREVYLLNPAQDAIQQITQTLLGRSGISSLEIISHGADGALKLGADWLSFDNLGQYSQQIQSWSQAMTDDGDILLYGCNVAQSQRGLAFLQALSQLTQADIAASDNFTGNAAIGGDWDLEVNVLSPIGRRYSSACSHRSWCRGSPPVAILPGVASPDRRRSVPMARRSSSAPPPIT
jgi:Domain of unknown function (DUF4347)